MNMQTEATATTPLSISTNESVFWIVAILFYGFGDIITTLAGLQIAGITEGGPLVALIVDQHGPGFIYVVKVTTIALFYLLWKVIPRPYRIGIPIGVSLVGIGVTVWNVGMILSVL